MTVREFEQSDGRSWSGALLALWWDAKGEWAKAHEVAQDIESADGAWVHAYLHRREGDAGNAAYWYRRAGRPAASGDLRAEWERMVEELLRSRGGSTD